MEDRYLMQWDVSVPGGIVKVTECIEMVIEVTGNEYPERKFRMTAISNMGAIYGYGETHMDEEPSTADCKAFAKEIGI